MGVLAPSETQKRADGQNVVKLPGFPTCSCGTMAIFQCCMITY